jgi:hypothetical protein
MDLGRATTSRSSVDCFVFPVLASYFGSKTFCSGNNSFTASFTMGVRRPSINMVLREIYFARFAKDCRSIIVDFNAYRIIRKNVYSNIWSLTFFRYFSPLWVAITVATYVSARDFIAGFGVRGISDAFWWVIILGVVLISFYTSIGFCFAYKTVRLTHLRQCDLLSS